MSKNPNLARHRATKVRANPLKAVSQAVSSNAGSFGRPAAAVVAASGLMLGFGAPANASTSNNADISASTAAVEQSTQQAVRADASGTAKVERANVSSTAATSKTTHTVKSGDTLSKIAAAYGVKLDTVFSLNGLGMESIIYPGDKIQLSGEAKATATADANTGSHTVKSGDTLGKIAAQSGVSLDTVLALNGLGVNSVIYPGDVIALSGNVAAASTAQVAPAAPVADASLASASVAPAAGNAANASSGVGLASSGAVEVIVPQQAAPAPAAKVAPVAKAAPAVKAAPASNVGAALVGAAYSQIGTGQDCTAMVEKALRSVGKSVGNIAPEHFYQYGSQVTSPAPGDLVISAGHVAIYVGNGKAVSGGFNGNQTVEHPLSYLSGYSFVRVAA